MSLSYIAGTVSRDEQFRFKKMVFRVTRGKAYTYFHDLVPEENDIKDYTGAIDKNLRSVYVIVFQDGGFLRSKITKVCDSFFARSVEIPSVFHKNELNQKQQDLAKRIIEAQRVIQLSRNRLKDYLREMQRVSQDPREIGDQPKDSISLLEVYRVFLQKEKALYSTLNKFKKEEKLFLGFCWIPKADNTSVLNQVENLKQNNRNIEIPTLKLV